MSDASRIGAAEISTSIRLSVLAEPFSLDAGVDLSGADADHQIVEALALAIRDMPERAADHLVLRPAEHALGGGVPHHDLVLEVDLDNGHRRCLDRRSQPLLARAQIVLAHFALGDVVTANEHALATEDVDDRRRRPFHDPLAAVLCDPAREAKLRVDAVERRRNADRREVAIFLVEDLPEAATAHLLVRPAHHLDEGVVDGVLDDPRLVVDDDQQARCDVGDLAEEVALAVELDLVLLALGHVEPAADDVADVAGLVQQRRSRPRDDQFLAAPVDERVLPGGGWVGRVLLEAFAHRIALGRAR